MFNESSIGPSGSGPILSSAASKRARPLCAASRCVKRSEEHTSELQSQSNLVCRLLLEKKKLREHVYPDDKDYCPHMNHFCFEIGCDRWPLVCILALSSLPDQSVRYCVICRHVQSSRTP